MPPPKLKNTHKVSVFRCGNNIRALNKSNVPVDVLWFLINVFSIVRCHQDYKGSWRKCWCETLHSELQLLNYCNILS